MTEINEKICPRCKGTGKIIWHDKVIGREFEGIDLENPCPACQLSLPPLDDKELERAIDEVVKGRLTSVETLAWHRQYDWSQKDKMIEEHLAYIRKDLVALLPSIEEARKQVAEEIREDLKKCGWFVNMGDGRWGEQKAAWDAFWEKHIGGKP